MDLVEIRKKAKHTRKKSAPKQTLKVEAEDLEQTPILEEPVRENVADTVEVPASPVIESVVDNQQEFIPVSEPDSVEVDPLEALFSFRVDGGLATEESYLKALMGDEEVADSDQHQWLTFSLGEEEYALDIEAVSEIIKPREVTDIPRVPNFIRGIISLRGIIVPVFDLRGRLKLGVVASGGTTRIIVCQHDGKMAGFLVDSINQVVNIPQSQIEPPPTVLSGLDRDFVEGVGRVDGRMLILLHLSNVINAELV